MIAYVRKQVVEKNTWLSESVFDSGVALCQAIPGAIIMQVAAFVGLKTRGIKGAIISFIGFGIPSFLMMLALSVLYKHLKNVSLVESVLAILRVVIAAIVAHAAFSFGKLNFRSINDAVISLIAAILFFIKLHPAIIIVVAGFLGLILSKPNMIKYSNTGRSRTIRVFIILLILVILCLFILFFINKSYFTLATLMLRIDLYSFGGGLAAVPIMLHEFVDLYGWFDNKTFLDGIILGQATPGSIIITATFVGYMRFGILGSVVSTICVFTPSFLILMGLVPFFDKLSTYPQFKKVVNGILCSFVGLLAVTTWHFASDIHWSVVNTILAIVAFFLLLYKVDVIWIILGAVLLALVGL